MKLLTKLIKIITDFFTFDAKFASLNKKNKTTKDTLFLYSFYRYWYIKYEERLKLRKDSKDIDINSNSIGYFFYSQYYKFYLNLLNPPHYVVVLDLIIVLPIILVLIILKLINFILLKLINIIQQFYTYLLEKDNIYINVSLHIFFVSLYVLEILIYPFKMLYYFYKVIIIYTLKYIYNIIYNIIQFFLIMCLIRIHIILSIIIFIVDIVNFMGSMIVYTIRFLYDIIKIIIITYPVEIYRKFQNNKLALWEMFIFQLLFLIVVMVLFLSFKARFLIKFFFLFFCAMFHIICIKSSNHHLIKLWGLFWSIIIFLSMLIYLLAIVMYSKGTNEFYLTKYVFTFFGTKVIYGIDIISLLFLLLLAFIFLIIFLYLFTVEMVELKLYYLIIYTLYFMLINIFMSQNLFFFFFFFEGSVIPMFIMILMGGSRFQKFKAANYFLFFTIMGSIFMFISINYLYFKLGTINISELIPLMEELTTVEKRLIWLSFFISFAIKIPLFPFHTWLPEAHVEAPTVGSVILAGILLKLGVYGFIRVCFVLLPEANVFFSNYVYILCVMGILHSCIIAIRQTDIKRIIAYASVAHMNLIILGLFSFSSVGIYGAIYQSISHGLVSSALFLLVGMLYNRYKTRLITYYGGLAQIMPIFSFFYLLFTLSNISFPLSSNFMGELLLFVGISKLYFVILILSLFGIILNTIYSLWLCNRILYGNVKSHFLIGFKDLIYLEIFILSLLLFWVILLGIFPNMIGGISLPLKHSLLFVIKTLSVNHSIYL